MKKILILFFLSFSFIVFSQDTIYIKAKPVTGNIVKEKMYNVYVNKSFGDSSLEYKINKKDIDSIKYNFGYTKLFCDKRNKLPFGIAAGIGFDEDYYVLSCKADYFISPQLNYELNLGGGYFKTGPNLFLQRTNNLNRKLFPNAGIHYGYEYWNFMDDFVDFSVGLAYIGNAGYNYSITVNEWIFLNIEKQVGFSVNFMFGYRF